MRTLTLGKKHYSVPGNWNEMTAEQLVFLAMSLRGDTTAQEVKLKMALFALNARVRRYDRAGGNGYAVSVGKDIYYLAAEGFASMAGVFGFLFREEDGRAELDIGLTRDPWPVYRAKGIELYGPADGLTDISYGQFIMLQSWQGRMADGFDEALDGFLSVIWKRGAFDTSDDGDPAWTRDVDRHVKIVMFWFFLGCMRFIEGKFPRVFGGTGESDGVDQFDAQQRLVDEMAGGDVTKKELVKRSLLYDALYTLDMAIGREAERRKNGSCS